MIQNNDGSKVLEIVVLKQARRELRDAPADLIQDVFALIDDLAGGKTLSMPISRALPSIARGLHELRLSGIRGEYRVFYVIRVCDAIYIIHAMEKKKNEIDKRTMNLLKARIRSLGI